MKYNNGMMRLLSFALCLCLMLGLVYGTAPVEAEAAETKNLTINLFDSYGDGWGGNAIQILEDGVVIDTATIEQGKEAIWSYAMDPDKSYAFAWVKGSWSSECYFDILIDGEKVFSATGCDCNLLADGKVFYPECEHLDCNAVVTPPSCKKTGYTTYTCNDCGEVYTGDETPATGHSFGDDDFCDTCGFDKNSIPVVITMTDSWGDGWNGNAILIYENGELIDTATLEAGQRNATWTYYMDSKKQYDFYWKLGNFPNECSFTIAFDDEIVYSAINTTCSKLKDNELFYPPCPHVDCDSVVTPPTCTAYGYTTYTCKKCGESFTGDIEYAMGHEYGNDSICDVCGFDKDGIIINMTDSYGDGWNGNALEIYEDGVLIGTATLESGKDGMYVVSVKDGKEYTFNWVKGNACYECSFNVTQQGQVLYSVTGSQCDSFVSGQQVYPYKEYSGWTVFGTKVYYFDTVTHKPLTNAQRLPYPTEPLNGITYAPDPADIAYYESLGQTFIDKEKAWFVFDSFSGVLMQDITAIRSLGINGTYDYRYVVQGMLPWNVGLVQENGYYWYFAGNTAHGGNTVFYGDVTVNRNSSDFDAVIGGIYTFDWIGHMCNYDGITNVNGTLRYYENCRLMVNNGLTKVGENFIYVLPNGELVVNTEYDVPANGYDIAAGTYTFDENGYLLNPVAADKNGVYYENGAWYYYENGRIGYNKGLINVSGYWHFADGTAAEYTAFVYVRSNGQLATGSYYITNVENDASGLYAAGQKVAFDDNGMACAAKNGVHEVGGKLYYFANDMIQYGAGLLEVDGGWIYVRSNGTLAIGQYWITNTNGAMEADYYEFDENGFMIFTEKEDGIVESSGALNYYQDGLKQFGSGLVQLENGSYIYVRTNGELAVGTYWITNHHGLLPEGMYEFDENGILSAN